MTRATGRCMGRRRRPRAAPLWLGALAVVTLLAVPPASGATDADFAALVRTATATYPSAGARLHVGDAFFKFETSALDGQVAATDPALYREIERRWLALAAEMKAGAPAATVRADGEALAALLERAAGAARSPASAVSLFTDGLLIILREGFEAILILAALAAYLVQVGAAEKRRLLYLGAGVAVAASLSLAIAASRLLPTLGSAREALEGVTMLLAVVVLFAASYWLISKSEARHWQAFVRARIQGALGTGSGGALVLVAFLVVFREGFETVLFYEALAMRAEHLAVGLATVGSGFAVGTVLLAVVAVALVRYGVRLPLRPFFAITGALLYVLAFKFAGAGVRELQEAGWVSVTPVALPNLAGLADWLGIHPFVEPLLAQGALLVALLAGIVYTLVMRQLPALDEGEAAGS
jgi:high-affinity iron transporter